MFDTLPEVSHVETMMDGILDSLKGTESLDLTYAQRYVIGVLDSNDITRSSVTGTEGLLSDIGDGLAKVWEYVKKMFKAIWDFFFGKKNKEDSEAAKASVKSAEEAVKEVESPQVTEENVKAVVSQVEKKVNKLPESPKKKELQKKVETVKAAEPAKAKAAAPGLIKEVYDADLADKPKLNEMAKKFKVLYEDLTARKDEYAKNEGDRKVLGHAIQTFLNGFTGLKEPRKGLAETKAWITWAHRCLEATDNSLETIRAMKSEHEHAIRDTQAKIDGLSKSQYSKQELIEEITDLKRVMATVVTVIKLAEQTRECISEMAKGIEACCIKTKEKS
jgi:hypothetical protein